MEKKRQNSLFAGENPKDTIRKLLELICEFSNITGYKIKHRNPFQTYRPTMKNQNEIEETIPITIATKRIKYLRINLRRQKTCLQKIIRH